jgi:sec-independent protein translocase protein TatB
MFDIAPTELLLVAVVALLVIGPKDLPKAMRVVGYWVGKARGAARQFRSGFDAMVREAELAEMEKKWKAENERIMREYPAEPALPAPEPVALPAPEGDPEPVMVAQPEIRPEPDEAVEAPPAPKPKRKPRAKAAS